MRPASPDHDIAPLPMLERSRGELRLGFVRRGPATAISDLYQQGCAKARLVRQEGPFREVIILNTAGGLTDGDRYSCAATWGPGATAMVTSQAAERIYRSRGAAAELTTSLAVGAGAKAVWAPQETILFDGGRYRRRTTIDVAEDGEAVACEAIVFGRSAMGETVKSGGLEDSWRVSIEGKLVYADGLSLEGDIAGALARQAIGGGAVATATVLYAGARAAAMRDLVRPLLDAAGVVAGCSTRLGVTVVRLLAHAASALRRVLEAVIEVLTEAFIGALSPVGVPQASALPRAWRL